MVAALQGGEDGLRWTAPPWRAGTESVLCLCSKVLTGCRTTIAAVGDRSAPAASPVKRIRTWEEIVKQRAQLAAANGAAVEKPGTAEAAAEAESEEDGALPEEGELPNVK